MEPLMVPKRQRQARRVRIQKDSTWRFPCGTAAWLCRQEHKYTCGATVWVLNAPRFKSLVPNVPRLKGSRHLNSKGGFQPQETWKTQIPSPLHGYVSLFTHVLPTGSKAAAPTRQGLRNLKLLAQLLCGGNKKHNCTQEIKPHRTTDTNTRVPVKTPKRVRSGVMVMALFNAAFLFWYCDITMEKDCVTCIIILGILQLSVNL